MCSPPLGPFGASPDDSQAAQRPRDLEPPPGGYPPAVAGFPPIRARALCALLLAVAGVSALAVGVASGAAEAERTKPRPTPSRSTCRARRRAVPARPRPARTAIAISSPCTPTTRARRSAASAPTRTATSRASACWAAFVTAEAVSARAFADGRKAQATGTFGGSVTGLVVAGASVSVPPGGQFEIPGIGYGSVSERRVVRSGGALSRLRGGSAHPPQLRLARPARRAPRSCSATPRPRRPARRRPRGASRDDAGDPG